jgi:hypothetical protein
MAVNRLNSKSTAPRELFLSAIADFVAQTSLFKERLESIWVNHRKELLVKPDLEKHLQYALAAEYLPEYLQDYYTKNHHFLETATELLQHVLDKYHLGRILECSTVGQKRNKAANINSLYAVKTSSDKFLVIETSDDTPLKKHLESYKEVTDVKTAKHIGIAHSYDKYFYIYQTL